MFPVLVQILVNLPKVIGALLKIGSFLEKQWGPEWMKMAVQTSELVDALEKARSKDDKKKIAETLRKSFRNIDAS